MMEPIYEKTKQKEDSLLRISRMLFDYKNNILPPWQPLQRDPRTCCHHHLHEKIELLYFIEGAVIFRIDGTPYTCNPGDFLIVNPFEPHSGVTSPECDVVRYYAFNLDCSLLKKLPVSRLSEIFDPLLSGSAAYPHTLPATDPTGQIIRAELEAILATLQTRNAELYQIASVCRIFAALGDPIENAHALIRGGNRNLSEVAQLSGFNYYAYFFRKFKEVSGMTPGEYVAYCDRLEKK